MFAIFCELCDNSNHFYLRQSIQPLLKLAALAISIEMNGKTPDEIRPMFGISNDLNNPAEKARVKAENEWAIESRRRFDERRMNNMDT